MSTRGGSKKQTKYFSFSIEISQEVIIGEDSYNNEEKMTNNDCADYNVTDEKKTTYFTIIKLRENYGN